MQKSREIRAEALRQEIEKAFAAVSYPGDNNITRSTHAMSDGRRYQCDECVEIRQIFCGKKWQEWEDNPLKLVGSAVVEQGALSLFSPEAFQYYLPLFLIAATAFYEKSNLIPDNIIFAFSAAEEPALRERKKKRLCLFTVEQHKVVLACLTFLKEEHREDFSGHEVDAAIKNIANELQQRSLES
jgi:hypothetical protein